MPIGYKFPTAGHAAVIADVFRTVCEKCTVHALVVNRANSVISLAFVFLHRVLGSSPANEVLCNAQAATALRVLAQRDPHALESARIQEDLFLAIDSETDPHTAHEVLDVRTAADLSCISKSCLSGFQVTGTPHSVSWPRLRIQSVRISRAETVKHATTLLRNPCLVSRWVLLQRKPAKREHEFGRLRSCRGVGLPHSRHHDAQVLRS